MKQRSSVLAHILLAGCLSAGAAEIKKANNTEPLNTGASWALGAVPTAADVALWDSTVTGANSSLLNADVTWDGLKVTTPGGAVTIGGSGVLSLDGGASTDISLTSATRDLTLACPVSMSGTMTTDVAAGRTLTFEGPLNLATGGTWSRTGWGTVVFDGPITSGVAATALELQRGTNVFTGKSGGLRLTSTSTSRLYVGRITGDATLIISNGVHETRGDDQASANFVGLTYRGLLVMEGGSLRVTYLRQGINNGNGDIIVNGGTLEATGSGASGTASYALMIGNNHTDATTATYGSGTLTVNGGQALFTNGIVKIASESSGSTGAQAVNLNGGELALKRFYVGASVQVPKTVTLSGGTLRLAGSGSLFLGPGVTNGTLKVFVGNGGAVFDTGAYDVTNAPALLAAGAGGVTKLGAGTLTLQGTNTYTGQTRVQAGVLRFAGLAAARQPSLFLTGGGLSLRDGALATFAPSAFTNLAAGAATLELEVSATTAECDVLALPAGTRLGRVDVRPVVAGSGRRAFVSRDHVIMTYAGGAPDISRLTVLDPAPGATYTFLLDTEAKTVTLRIAAAAGVSEWIAPNGGAWETAGNWTAFPANAAGSTALLGDFALTSPATVTAASPVTLGGLTFSSLLGYTLAGGGFTFDNGAAASYAAAEKGAHVVAAPLTLAGAFSAAPATGASLTLAGAVGGTGALVKGGEGEVVLAQANTYAGGTQVKGGSVILTGGATLGSGPITVDGGSGFRFGRTAALTLSAPVTVATTAHFNTASNDVALTGTVDWQGSSRALVKSGPYELALSGSGSETDYCKFQIENGSLRFQSGAAFSLLSTADRDGINMKANYAYARHVFVEQGAQVTASGIDMEYGVSNTVTVSGGRLRLVGGGAGGDALAMRGQGAGADRVIVNAGELTVDDGKWVGVGFRVGDAYLVINGGTATLSRVSLGARDLDQDLSARGFVNVNGGLLEVRGNFGWMGSSTAGRTNIFTLGNGTPGSGVWRTCATSNPRYDKSNTPIMVFNGGTLEARGLAAYGTSSLSDYLYGAKQVYVNAGGARIDTRGLDIAIAQPLQKGAVTDGGLTKLGAGRLTLAGACAFTGATTVEEGALTVPSSYASAGLSLAAGTAFSLANGGVQTLSLGGASLASGVTVTFEALADGSCDRMELPADATVGDLTVTVVQAGTALTVTKPGDYTLFACAGTPPATGGWTLLNPSPSRTYTFETVGSAVVLRVAYAAAADAVWTSSGSGAWETAGNWSAAPADAAGTVVRFDDAISAAATVTRGSVSTVGTAIFNNAAPYTLAGAALTLQGAGETPAVVESESGTHTLTAPLVLAGDTVVRAASGAGIALNGGVSGSATLTVEGPGTLALPDTAGLAVDGLGFASGGVLVVSNTATLNTPALLGAGGGVFAPAAGTRLDLLGAVSGAGGLAKTTSSFLTLTNGNALYTGATRVGAGTVISDALTDGGLVFGQGTFHYVGAGATTAGGYALDTGDNTRAGVLRADGDITFEGNVSAASGALVKTGPGTVTFSAPGLNVFNVGNGAGTSHSVLDIGAYGDSPTVGFSGFSIADGKVVLGAAGQTNLFAGLLVVGLNTTTNADAETAGALDVVGGVTTVGEALIVGRSNGYTNTAASARVSRLRMTGGELSVPTLVLARVLNAAGINTAPEAELAGGVLTAANPVLVAEGNNTFGTLKLSGGTLVAPTIQRGGGQGTLIFDGGAFRPSGVDQWLNNLSGVQVAAGGAHFDLSQASVYVVSLALSGDGADGGLTKTGAGKLTLNAKQQYGGPTLVSEGTLRFPLAGGLSNVTALTVSPGAALELDIAGTQTLSVASLALGAAASAPAAVQMAMLSDGSGNDRIAVSGGCTLGAVAFTLVRVNAGDAIDRNGTYTLITYDAGTAAPSTAELSVANPLPGKRYTFAAADGAVTVTVDGDYAGDGGVAVWKATAGGAWSEASNWSVAPGAGGAGTPVRFDGSITAPATVTLGSGATVGALYFNNASAYTVDGAAALALDNGAGQPALLVSEQGAHVVSAPVTLPEAGATVQVATGNGLTLGALSGDGALVKTAGGTLTVAAASGRTGVTEIRGGELALKDGGNVGSGELVLDGAASLRATGSTAATLANPVTLKSSASGEPIVWTQERGLTLSGALDWRTGVGVVYKWGTNDLVLAGTGGSASGTPKLYHRQGGLVFASGANYTLTGSTRESIKLGLNPNDKTSMTVEPGARLSVGGILVSAAASNTGGNDALLTQNGGEVALNNVSGDSGDALYLRDWGTAPAIYVMNGGVFTMPSAAWANLGNCGPARIRVNGGSMTLGRVAAGYQTATNANGGSAEVTVNGGRLAAAGSWSWASDRGARAFYTRVNGGTLALPATRAYATNVNGWAELALAGGTLELSGEALDAASTDDYLAGVRRVAVDGDGAIIDTQGLNVTLRQNVLGLSATGGVTKVGTGSLTLAGTNVLYGLVDVQAGTLRARLTRADTPSAPLFRLGMDTVENPDLSGNGFVPAVSNPGTFTPVSRSATAAALGFSGTGWYTLPHNPHFTNITEFTVAAWVLITNNVTDSNRSILSARPGGDRAFELKLNTGNLVRILQHSNEGQAWWQEFRTVNALQVGQWSHVAVSLTPQGVAMYLNGVRQQPIKQVYTGGGTSRDYPGSGYYFPGDFRFVPAGRTGGLIVGRPTSGAGPGFNGALDDLMVFERVLTDAEVAALAAEVPARPASVRVAWQGVFDMLGAQTAVAEASGSGQIVNGGLAVQEKLSVGDTPDEAPGAVLTVSSLTLGTNVVYGCSCDGTVNDLTVVGGELAVDGAGVVDFGRTAENPITSGFSATVMTYGTVTGAENFASWTVTGLGRRGFASTVSAADGEVRVTLQAQWGTLLKLR